jgi:hypothetical protein
MFAQGITGLGQAKAAKFTLDPNVIGTAANILSAVSGSIVVTGSAPAKYWDVNADEIASYDCISAPFDVEFTVNVTVKPTAADVRAWGLKSPALGNRGRIEFDVTDTAFTAKVYDDAGTAQTVTGGTITWDDATWTNKVVRFRIRHTGSRVEFLVNETVKAYADVSSGANLPSTPLHIHMNNANADSLRFFAICTRQAFNL